MSDEVAMYVCRHSLDEHNAETQNIEPKFLVNADLGVCGVYLCVDAYWFQASL